MRITEDVYKDCINIVILVLGYIALHPNPSSWMQIR